MMLHLERDLRPASRPGFGSRLTLLSAWFLTASLALGGELVAQLPAVADTGLYEISPTNNLGAVINVPAGVHNEAKRSRYLLRFEPAALLPPDAEIDSVELVLGVGTANLAPVTCDLHRMLTPWTEGTRTGNNGSPAATGETTWLARAHPATLWSSPGAAAGADYTATSSATQVFAGANTNVTLSSPAMAADVQLWLDQPGTNFGWLLKAADETVSQTVRRIFSRESSTNAPQLVVRYHLGPQLQIATVGPGQLQLSFTARPNRPYTLESAPALTNGAWLVRTNLAAQPIAATHIFLDTITNHSQFYRVK